MPYFDYANFFKDIFKIFSKVLITNNKKQQLTAVLCKLPDRSIPTLRSLTQSRHTLAATQMNRSGHIIILRPDLDKIKYETSDFMQKNLEHLDRLRKLLDFIDPSKYRGTGREFFSSAPYFYDADKGVLEHWETADLTTYDSLQARQLFAKLEEANTPMDTLDDLCFFSLSDMQSVYDLLDNKEKYEIIEFIENETDTNSKTLGFDVGYLAADYSVIADTAIKPTWHGPDFDDMQDIIEHLKKLNEHCLFPTFQDAKNYRELYLTKTWGEKEMYDGQITTIQIRTT